MEPSNERRNDRSVTPTLPAATQVGAVTLQVSRLDRSLEYYTEILGFAVLNQSAGQAKLGVAGESHLLELIERPNAAPARRPQLGLYHFAILLPDRAHLGRFIQHVADRQVQIGAADHLVSEATYLYDPDGLGIEVYTDRPRSAWRLVDGELAMATDPLDFRSLLAAGAGSSWTGMPPGTTMGHMHLSVGNLQQARDFYHALLGLDVMVTRYPGALFLAAGGYHHHLGLNTWAGPAARVAAADAARLVRWELVLPQRADIDAVAERLEQSSHAVTRNTDGSIDVADPWEIGLRLRAA